MSRRRMLEITPPRVWPDLKKIPSGRIFDPEARNLDIVEPAGGFGTEGHAGMGVADDAVANLHLTAWAGYAQPIPVASSLDADGVIVDRQIATLDQQPLGGVDIDAVGRGAASADVVANDQIGDLHIARIADVDSPEARPG